MRVFLLLLFIIILPGCEKIYFGEAPDNSPPTNFEIFWKDFDRFYGQFEIRHIDWDSVYTIYRQQINSNSSKQDLFNVFNSMVQLLKDEHVNLYTPLGVSSYNKLFPSNYYGGELINPDKYILFSSLQNTVIKFGTINSYNIGYIQIATFRSNEFGKADSHYNIIDSIIQQFKDKDGIIIDVRGNRGGNSENSTTIASRFAGKKYLYFKEKYKHGPGKNDFSEWIDFYFSPQGEIQFLKPVVVLTSKYTISAAEVFVCAMSVLPKTTLVGDTTAGGIGDPVYRELPIGWSYRLSTSVGAMANGQIIESKGIAPKFWVVTSKEDIDTVNSRDPMLEKGIEVITNSKRK